LQARKGIKPLRKADKLTYRPLLEDNVSTLGNEKMIQIELPKRRAVQGVDYNELTQNIIGELEKFKTQFPELTLTQKTVSPPSNAQSSVSEIVLWVIAAQSTQVGKTVTDLAVKQLILALNRIVKAGVKAVVSEQTFENVSVRIDSWEKNIVLPMTNAVIKDLSNSK
jgi:hypothetical protein